MFEARGRGGEFNGFLIGIVSDQAIEQAAHEGVAAADAVDDVGDVVATALPERLAVVEHAAPGVVVRVDRTAERDGHLLAAREHLHQLLADAFEPGLVDLAARLLGVEAFGLDAEFLLRVFLVAEDQVAAGHEGGHHLGSGLAVLPELLAIVQVAGHLHAELIGHLDGLEAGVGRALAQGRRDAGPVEPVGAGEHLAPVHHAGLDLGDGGVRAVVNDLAAAGHGPGLEIVDAHAVAAVHHAVEVHPQTAEFGQTHIGDIVLGHARHEMRIDAVVGQRHGHIGLAAAEGGVELPGLREAQIPRRGKAKHHFAESHNFCHIIVNLLLHTSPYRCSRRSRRTYPR